MQLAVDILRIISLLAFAGPLLMGSRGPRPTGKVANRGNSVPLYANLIAFIIFFPVLLATEDISGHVSLELALGGTALSIVGSLVALRSRAHLGRSWSLTPKAVEGAGIVTTGPYRWVRHPIYLGLVLLTLGEAAAFASVPALFVAGLAIVPTFLWRARVEEEVLTSAVGTEYLAYKVRTPALIPVPRLVPYAHPVSKETKPSASSNS